MEINHHALHGAASVVFSEIARRFPVVASRDDYTTPVWINERFGSIKPEPI
jgi:hypothetical protein